MKSDTPRTDAVLSAMQKNGFGPDFAPVDFTKTLERDLTAAQEKLAAVTADLEAVRETSDARLGEITKQRIELRNLEAEWDKAIGEAAELRSALERLRDCDWVISLPDRMDAVRKIARDALASTTAGVVHKSPVEVVELQALADQLQSVIDAGPKAVSVALKVGQSIALAAAKMKHFEGEEWAQVLQEQIDTGIKENIELEDKVAELEKDRARLDKIERTKLTIIPCYGKQPAMGSGLPIPFEGFVTDTHYHEPKPLRQAIDAAKEGEKE
jgi:hypothetical protein